MRANPFFEMYVGDRLSAADFVTIFSPFLVRHAAPLFMAGNVVVTGVQGSGKTMLLSLLKPDVRLKYAETGIDFPVPKAQQKFLSSIVNVAHSSVTDFGYRRHDPDEVNFLFADFLNYLIVRNFLENIKILFDKAPIRIKREVGLNVTGIVELDAMAVALSTLEVWNGWMSKCRSFEDLMGRLNKRISLYREYLTKKVDNIDESILKTRTSIGDPIIKCVEALKENKYIDSDTNVLVDIDQYEELGNIVTNGNDIDYRSVINKALSSRNPSVSYKIGTRGHAWRGHSKIWGTTASLEEDRDYKYVDLEKMLKRYESGKVNIFPSFAEDVFDRRVRFSGAYPIGAEPKGLMTRFYGPALSAADKIKALSLRNPKRALRLEKDWPDDVKERLGELASKDLLSARLGEAWIRQKGIKGVLTRDEELPWEEMRWWKKERVNLAVLQIASRAQQHAIWGGIDDFIDLSGGNILVFLSLNHHVWEVWLQSRLEPITENSPPPYVPLPLQNIGIQNASEFWVKKINQETGRSSERARFVRSVATELSRNLLEDIKMSNPGHNGFSLIEQELDSNADIYEFLKELADYGTCIMLDHTTKSKDGRRRQKFYFNPVFSPYFKIPSIRTKEPSYVSIKAVAKWIYDAGYNVKLAPISADENLRLL